jgi:hypothetical protein
MTETEKLIITMLNRLYWSITQAPGVARYASDVKLFKDADSLLNPENKERNDKTIANYSK